MEKVKKFFTNKTTLIICCVVAAVLIVLLIVLLASGGQEKKLEKELKELGKVYYEEVYYGSWGDDVDGRTELLEKFVTLGIKSDLSNLVRAVAGKNGLASEEEILADFVNSKTGKQCNRTNTKVTFYPSEPFEKTDYKMEVQIDCGFEE